MNAQLLVNDKKKLYITINFSNQLFNNMKAIVQTGWFVLAFVALQNVATAQIEVNASILAKAEVQMPAQVTSVSDLDFSLIQLGVPKNLGFINNVLGGLPVTGNEKTGIFLINKVPGDDIEVECLLPSFLEPEDGMGDALPIGDWQLRLRTGDQMAPTWEQTFIGPVNSSTIPEIVGASLLYVDIAGKVTAPTTLAIKAYEAEIVLYVTYF